jgi:phospholipase/carboxylesterase
MAERRADPKPNAAVADYSSGTLTARPTMAPRPGLHGFGQVNGREAALYVPAGYRAETPAHFVLSFHGAGGSAVGGLYPFRDLADAAGLVLLSPSSDASTWDLLGGGFGPDVAFVDELLHRAFGLVNIDPTRIGIAGFSDGASYALSLGLTNGDLFDSILAFSPGFAAPASKHGDPRIFISHGTNDAVLRIDMTSRRVVPRLQRIGYDVDYVEFDGGHNVPAQVARQAVDWFLSGTNSSATEIG